MIPLCMTRQGGSGYTGRRKRTKVGEEIPWDQVLNNNQFSFIPICLGLHQLVVFIGFKYISQQASNSFLFALEEHEGIVLVLILKSADNSTRPTLAKFCGGFQGK